MHRLAGGVRRRVAFNVYARRYGADGAALGGEFRVNTYTAGDQLAPRVAVDPDGDFVRAWWSEFQDGDWGGVYARVHAN